MRNIQEDDNLSGKTIYINTAEVRRMMNDNSFCRIDGDDYYIGYINGSSCFGLWTEAGTLVANLNYVSVYKLPDDFGVVTFVGYNTDYDVIKITEHEKVSAICENMCLEETLTKEQMPYYFAKKDSFAVVEGSMTLTANTSDNVSSDVEMQTAKLIDFPTGFNKDNCVCLAFGMKVEGKNYSYGSNYCSSSYNVVAGSFNRNIVLGASEDNTKIRLDVTQMKTSATDVEYRIVLMKIS